MNSRFNGIGSIDNSSNPIILEAINIFNIEVDGIIVALNSDKKETSGEKYNLLKSKKLWQSEKQDFKYKNGIAVIDKINADTYGKFNFWRDWYQGFLDGEPLDWNLQREVALISDAYWDKGPEFIAGIIAEIRKKYDQKPATLPSLEDQLKSVSAKAKSTISQNVALNRDALAVSIAGLNEQLAAFQKKRKGIEPS